MYKLSVIIPMYNAGEYIVGCIENILSQTLDSIEIVVVNDCSSDDSMKLCRERFGSNDNIQLIDHSCNLGPGEARNTGIRNARGKYIAFVDSDDAIRKDAYRAMFDAAEQENADVLHVTGVLVQTVDDAPANLYDLSEDDIFHFTLDRGEKITEITRISDDMEERLKRYLAHEYHWAIWNKLFKRSFLLDNDIRFGKMKLAEDQVFCFQCLFHAKSYVILPGEWYMYRIGGVSLSRGQKSPSFMVRVLTSQLDMSECMERAMKGVEYFEKNPDCKEKAIQYVFDVLEDGFVIPYFKEIGEESLRGDKEMHDMFSSYFGDNALFAENEFFLAHKNIPEGESIYQQMVIPAFWRKVKASKNGK